MIRSATVPVTAIFLVLLFAGTLALRLCHADVVWVEEGYPMAAAQQILHGKALYKEVFFDKPPASAWVYLLWGAGTGWPLRLAGSIYVFGLCCLFYWMGRSVWGAREGVIAALMAAVFLNFGISGAVLPLAPDLLMMMPHIAAVLLAWQGRAFWSGVAAGVAMLINVKGVYVLAACLLWQWRAAPLLLGGFFAPQLVWGGYLLATGAWRDYWKQVFEWGLLYSSNSFVANPLREGAVRTSNWLGFQAAATAGALIFFWRMPKQDAWRWGVWLLISLAGVAAGLRFFPRYYFQALPALVLVGARGASLLERRGWIVLVLLLIPVVRFGPRYVELGVEELRHQPHNWSDLAMEQDSEAAATYLRAHARPEDSLLVWGYRPDIIAETDLPLGTPFLDSQPLTGVLADRHLFSSEVSAPEWAAKDRAILRTTSPTYIVDGLGGYNPSLAISSYSDLASWLSQYRLVAQTQHSKIYKHN